MSERYAVLEIQGFVYGIPSYDRKANKLTFTVTPTDGVRIPMFARGENARAFRSLLNSGVLIQAKAIPIQEIKAYPDGVERLRTEWFVKMLSVLSFKKAKLGPYSDLDVLDGLMPEDGDYEDVGYVEPESWGRFSARREALKRKGGSDD